jgi:polyhydroxyalkanoate synthase
MKDEQLDALRKAPRAKLAARGPKSTSSVEETAMTDKSREKRGMETAPQGADQSPGPSPDLPELSEQMSDIAERSRHLIAEFIKRQAAGDGVGMADPLSIGAAFFEMTARMMSDPSRLVQAQLSLWNDYMTLWQRTAQRFLGGSV